MFELLAAGLAILAFIFSRKAIEQARMLQTRVTELETRLGIAPAATAAEAPDVEPIETPPVTEPPRESIPVAPETPAPVVEPTQPTVEAFPAAEPAPLPAEEAVSPPPPPPAPPAPPETEPAMPETAGPAGPGVEERLGTRWVVWIGGLMLALGGLFLVKYSIEAGLLGPGVRVTLGALFALVLLALGEWSRRKETLSDIVQLPVANIPAVLTAAGTAVAFGVTYAAYALYGFLDPAVAFVLLGLVALATLALALLHGPALAGLGVVGAFAMPLLVSSETPNFWALYVYLAVVTAAALALARVRLWRWLAITTVAFGLFWLLPGLIDEKLIAQHAFHLIASFALAAIFVVAGFLFGPASEAKTVDRVSSGVLMAWLAGALLFALAHLHDTTALAVFALVVAATIGVAWRSDAAAAAVPAAGLATVALLACWHLLTTPDASMLPPFFRDMPRASGEPTALQVWLGIGLGLLFGLSGFLMQGRSGAARIATLWSATGAAAPILILIVLYARIAQFEHSLVFAAAAVALVAAFALATELLLKRDTRAGQQASVAIYATAALAALALGLTFALEKGWLTVALALMSPAAAFVSTKRPIPALRWLAGLLAFLVTARLGWNPRIVGADVGTTPVVNWLLWGYGVPALAFYVAGRIMRRQANDKPAGMAETASMVFATLLVFLEIRHFMTGGNIYESQSGLTEVALHVSSMLAMAIGWERLGQRTGSVVHSIGAGVLTMLAGAGAAFGLLLFENPMLTGESVGGLAINLLLLAYALPAVLATLLAKVAAGHRPEHTVRAIAAGGIVMAVAYVLLQIRCLFHGPVLTLGPTTTAEIAVQTCALLVMAIGLEFLGGRLGNAVHKAAAMVLTGLAGAVMLISLLVTRNPALSGESVDSAWLNIILLSYAAPAALTAILARVARGHRPAHYVHALSAATLALVTVYLMLQIKRFFQGPILPGWTSTAELAVQACTLIAMAIGLEVLTKRFGNLVANYGALVLAALGGVLMAAIVGMRLPIVTGEPVGGPIFNLVLLAFALPAVLVAALSKAASGQRPVAYVNALAGGALLLMLLYVSLEIRTLYHGPVLTAGPTTDAEQYTYSVAWLIFGVVMLGAGLALQSQRARLASAAVIGLTILKAFMIDMGGLTGVWRALSFIGLGLVLVAIGWLYQRILFPKRAASSTSP